MDGERLYLRRNVGDQRAIAVGLMHLAAAHDAANVVVMDSDGEDKPESAGELLCATDSSIGIKTVPPVAAARMPASTPSFAVVPITRAIWFRYDIES